MISVCLLRVAWGRLSTHIAIPFVKEVSISNEKSDSQIALQKFEIWKVRFEHSPHAWKSHRSEVEIARKIFKFIASLAKGLILGLDLRLDLG